LRGVYTVAGQPAVSFAGLLRQLRAEARLTQEELAQAAGLSPWSVSDLERGIHRTAHKDTAVLLAGALGLHGGARELFVAAARGRAPAGDVLAVVGGRPPVGLAAVRALPNNLPAQLAPFIGRERELSEVGPWWNPAAWSP
jgi:transcriptional regulator with XRE-family HTH domain